MKAKDILLTVSVSMSVSTITGGNSETVKKINLPFSSKEHHPHFLVIYKSLIEESGNRIICFRNQTRTCFRFQRVQKANRKQKETVGKKKKRIRK